MSNVTLLPTALSWNGQAPHDGWHWLQRRSDGVFRLGFFNRMGGWRVSDAIGRTELMGCLSVARRHRYCAPVQLPDLCPATPLEGER